MWTEEIPFGSVLHHRVLLCFLVGQRVGRLAEPSSSPSLPSLSCLSVGHICCFNCSISVLSPSSGRFPISLSPSLPDIPFLSISNLFSVTCHINSVLSRSISLSAAHLLRYLIIENFIPPEEKNKIMNRLYFDGEEDQWKFQPLVPTGGYVPVPDPRSACGAGVSPGLGGHQGSWDGRRCLRVEIMSKPSPSRKGDPSLPVDELRSSLFGHVFSRDRCSLMYVPLLIDFSEAATR